MLKFINKVMGLLKSYRLKILSTSLSFTKRAYDWFKTKIKSIFRFIQQVLNSTKNTIRRWIKDLNFNLRLGLFYIFRSLRGLFKEWTVWAFLIIDIIGFLIALTGLFNSISKESYIVISIVCLIVAINEVIRSGSYREISKESKKFIGHTFKINNIDLSSDGKMLLSSSDRVVLIWNVESRKIIQRLQCPTWVGRALFVDNDQKVIAIGGKGLFFIWDIASGETIKEIILENSESVALAISNNGTRIATSSKSGDVNIWSFPGLANEKVIKIGKTEVRKIAFSPISPLLIMSNVSGYVKQYNIETEELIELYSHPEMEGIRYIDYSPDGSKIGFIDTAGQAHLYNFATEKWLHSKKAHRDVGLCCVFSHDNEFLATSGQDNQIILWRIGSKKLYKLFYIDGHTDAVTTLSFDLTTNNLFSASRDEKIKYWKLNHLLNSIH